MKRIDLIKIENNTRVGDKCPYIEPNITEDCIFYENGIPIGFYIKEISKYSEKAQKLADLANLEFRSKNVPKTLLERSDVFQAVYKQGKSRKEAKATQTVQMSTIPGSIPPKPHMKRPYASKSSAHSVKSAETFVKAMLLLAKESEAIMQQIIPEQYEKQKKIFEDVAPKWRFGSLFTSSISNYNISAPFHRDTGNIEGCVNVIITKRLNAKGGNLHVPDYGATMDSANNSMLVYPAWKNIHGVTPIIETHDGGYRNSLVFYPLKAFVGLK